MQNLYKLKGRTFILFSLLSLFSFTLFGQVGINTTTPLTTLDVNGALSLRESPTPLVLATGQEILVDLGESPYSQYRIIGPSGPFSITRIKTLGEADGQIVRLINTTNHVMTIKHGDQAPLRILCPSETNLVIGGINSSVTLQYNKDLKRWTVFGFAIKQTGSKYSVFPVTNISKNNDSWTDMSGMSVTFTPVNSVVYVTYSVYGDMRKPGVGNTDTEGSFRLLLNGTPMYNTEIRTVPLSDGRPYQAMLPMFPLSVTPGTEITLKVQWSRNSGGTIYNSPAAPAPVNGGYPSHGRYITVLD